MCLSKIKKWICSDLADSDVPLPDIVGKIDYNSLYTILKAEYGEDVVIFLPDECYELATMESFKSFLNHDKTDLYKYTGDPGLDCDDYAAILHGRGSIPEWATVPIGTIWLSTPPHAVNIFIDEEVTPYLVEPQSDQIFRINEKNGWKAQIIWF